MEKSELRSIYLLAGFLVLAYATPFAVGFWTDSIFFDAQWLADLISVILNGFFQGGVYAMYAVGLTLIFGVMRLINLAHGELVVLGAYLTWTIFNTPHFLGYDFYIDPLLTMVITLPWRLRWDISSKKCCSTPWSGGRN